MGSNRSAQDEVEIIRRHHIGTKPPEIAPIIEGLTTAGEVQKQFANTLVASNARNILSGSTRASRTGTTMPMPSSPHNCRAQSNCIPGVERYPASSFAITPGLTIQTLMLK